MKFSIKGIYVGRVLRRIEKENSVKQLGKGKKSSRCLISIDFSLRLQCRFFFLASSICATVSHRETWFLHIFVFKWPCSLISAVGAMPVGHLAPSWRRRLVIKSLCPFLISPWWSSYTFLRHTMWFLVSVFPECLPSHSLIAQLVKNPPATQETLVQFLGWEDPLEEG